MRLYGIRTCDTCRAALRALTEAGRPVEFVDVRATPLSPDRIATLLEALGPALVNRSSATWRGLSEAERDASPAELLVCHPTLMKRPLIEDGDRLWLGWTPDVRADVLG